LTEFAAAAAPDAESVLVGVGVGEGAGDFAGELAALGKLFAVAELLALAEDSALFVLLAELGAALPVCFASPLPLGVALTLRVLPSLALADVGDAEGAVFVGVVVGVGVSVGDGDEPDVPPVDEPDVGEELGDGDGDGLGVFVGEGDGDGDLE
jgi:hypothetical protein